MDRSSGPVYDSAREPAVFFAEIREVFQYRHLLENLVYRDLTIRYKRSWLGALWILLNPILTMIVLTLVFSARLNNQVENYPVFLLSGLVIWNVFAEASPSAMRALLAHSNIVTKVHVPPSIFIIASVVSSFIIHLVELLPLMVITVILGVSPKVGWLLTIIPMMQIAVFSLGVGLMLSALVAYFADILNVYDVFLRLLFFLSPIIYPISLFTGLQWLETLNPLSYIIASFRSIILDGRLRVGAELLPATLISVGALVCGWYIFTRVKFEFAYRT